VIHRCPQRGRCRGCGVPLPCVDADVRGRPVTGRIGDGGTGRFGPSASVEFAPEVEVLSLGCFQCSAQGLGFVPVLFLEVRDLGALPVVNHFLARAGLPGLLERYLPATDARVRLAPATAVRLVVTNLLLGRQPLYGLGEWAARFAPGQLGLAAGEVDVSSAGRAVKAR
jgi:hypothetical protein